VADGTGAATVVMKSPRIKSATWSGSYFVSAYATDAQGSFLGVTAFPQTGADLHFTLPPPFAYSPASVKASTPYPRIEQAFTTSTDGTVHTISYGLPDRGWTAFATTAWFGAAGKPVTWEFPDLTAVAGWGGALWADWAMGDFTVALTTSSCATLQRTVLESLLPPTPQPGDSCSTIQTNGSDVTLP